MADRTAVAQSVQRRARQQLSCVACRSGKLRCNRQLPCDQCLKRSKDATCQYLPPPDKRKKALRNTKDRIAHLEGLVVQLISQNRPGAASSSSPEDDGKSSGLNGNSSSESPVTSISTSDSSVAETSTHDIGQLKISHGGTSYVGSAHWEAILENIAELKAELNDEEDDEGDAPDSAKPAPFGLEVPFFMLGGGERLSKEALIRSVPPRAVADRLLWHWFNSPDPGLPSIHKPTFLLEYAAVYENPAETHVMWLAILFAILSVGTRLASFATTPGDSVLEQHTDMSADRFQQLAACALSLGDFTKAKKYTLEALMFYAGCEYMKPDDHIVRLWLFMGCVVRTALRMGYHRDPSHYPSITPFEGEMRRRVWQLARVFDVLTSFQLALPSITMTVESDTRRPRNLLDSDFGPDTVELPPSRPLTEMSPVSFPIAKHDLVMVLAKAAEISHRIQPLDYESVMEVDQRLREVRDAIPQILQFSSMSQAFLDPPVVVYNRFKFEMLYQKTRCVLHRRYLTESLSDPRGDYSRKACVDAALKLLEHHTSLFDASQDPSQLNSTRWFLASLNAHDFLLSSMVICLELNLISKASSTAEAPGKPDEAKVEEMKRVLLKSYMIYKNTMKHSPDATKAVKAMEIMLEKVGHLPKEEPEFQLPIILGNGALTGAFSIAPDILPNVDTLPMGSNSLPQFEPIGDMFDTGQNADWQMWDNFITTGGSEIHQDVSFPAFDFMSATSAFPGNLDPALLATLDAQNGMNGMNGMNGNGML